MLLLSRAKPGSVEDSLFQEQLSKDPIKFSPMQFDELSENFIAAEQGVFFANDLRTAILIARIGQQGCDMKVKTFVNYAFNFVLVVVYLHMQ